MTTVKHYIEELNEDNNLISAMPKDAAWTLKNAMMNVLADAQIHERDLEGEYFRAIKILEYANSLYKEG